MSVSSSAYFINGIKFCLNDAIVENPNPLYGKCKFDPDTGKEVTPCVEDRKAYNILEQYVDDMGKSSCSIYKYIGGYSDGHHQRICFCGDVVDVDANEDAMVRTDDSVLTRSDIVELMQLLTKHNVAYETGSFVAASMG